MSIKKAIIILIVIAVAGSICVFLFTRNTDTTVYSVNTVKSGKIIQTVSETGKVKSDKEINLGFQAGGQLKKVYVKVGDVAEAGKLLAELNSDSLLIAKKQAEAGLESAKSNLNKLMSGATKQDISVTKADNEKAEAAYNAAKKDYAEIQDVVNENIVQAKKSVNDLEQKSPNNITSQEQAIIVAETNLNNAKSTYQKSINDTSKTLISTLDDKLSAANKALDVIDAVLTNRDAKDFLSIKDKSYLTKTTNEKDEALRLWTSAVSKLNSAKSNYDETLITEAYTLAISVLNKTFSSLQNCYKVLENSGTSITFPQTSLDTMKTNVNAQQTVLGAAILSAQSAKQNYDGAILTYSNNVLAAEESLRQARASYDDALLAAKNNLIKAQKSGQQQIVSAQSQVDLAANTLKISERQLEKVLAPANQHDIDLANAEIKRAQAGVEAAVQNIKNNQIIAPIKGTITKINFEEGEQVSMSASAISMLGENNFEIEILVSEADITKVNVNDKSTLTLDAFGEDIKFEGQVYFIEPAETEVQDVIYYKVKISFKTENQNVKSGMTANAVITTAEKEKGLYIPSRSIIEKQTGEKVVRVLKNIKFNGQGSTNGEMQIPKSSAGEIEERAITTGIYGDESLVEVLTGLQEGEHIITYIQENKK